PLLVGNKTSTSLFYTSFLLPQTSANPLVATDSFSFRLIDAHGSLSPLVGVTTLNIISSLSVVNLTFPDQMGVAAEEVPTVVTLRGRNRRGVYAWFVVTSPPRNGTLYQYDSWSVKGEPLVFSSQGECHLPRLLHSLLVSHE
ncbi:MAG: hypothetical protein SGPRY_004224, partial [Prymnesium sp.]